MKAVDQLFIVCIAVLSGIQVRLIFLPNRWYDRIHRPTTLYLHLDEVTTTNSLSRKDIAGRSSNCLIEFDRMLDLSAAGVWPTFRTNLALTITIPQLRKLPTDLEGSVAVTSEEPPLLFFHWSFATQLGGIPHRGHELYLCIRQNTRKETQVKENDPSENTTRTGLCPATKIPERCVRALQLQRFIQLLRYQGEHPALMEICHHAHTMHNISDRPTVTRQHALYTIFSLGQQAHRRLFGLGEALIRDVLQTS